MILVDLNQIVISNLMQQINITNNENVEENFLRHMILTSLKSIKTKFSQYGEMVLCNDSTHSWRKDVFPYYKANRKKFREKSLYDWNVIFTSLNKIKKEIKENFPYKFIEVEHAEADDVIATLVMYNVDKEFLIISGDRDFVQLQKYGLTVKQYSPVQKKFIVEKSPHLSIIIKILRGDLGDGVPNVLSDDDSLVNPTKRQRRITEQFIKDYFSGKKINVPVNNWKRNQTLVDFEYIPKDICEKIYEEFNKPALGNIQKVHDYLLNNNMKILLSSYGDF